MGKKNSEKTARSELPPILRQRIFELAQQEREIRRRKANWMAVLGACLFLLSATAFLSLEAIGCTTSDRTEITRAADVGDEAAGETKEVTVNERECQPTFPYFAVSLAIVGGVLIAPMVIGLLPGDTSIEGFGAKLSHSEPPSLSSISQENLENLERKALEREEG